VFTASPGGGLAGTLAGAVIGFGINQLKDTSVITVAYRDIDKSALGQTDAAIQPSGKRYLDGRDTTCFTYTTEPPLIHIEDTPVGVDVGNETIWDL